MADLPLDALQLIAEAALRADPDVRRWAQLRMVAKEWNHWLAGPRDFLVAPVACRLSCLMIVSTICFVGQGASPCCTIHRAS